MATSLVADVPFSAIFQLPELLEQKAELMRCPVELSGVVLAPTAIVSVKLYKPGKTEITLEAPSIVGDVATVTIAAAVLQAEDLGTGWWVEWVLTIAGTDYTFVNDAALVAHRLFPTIGVSALYARMRSLDPASAHVITSMTAGDYQIKLFEVDVDVQLRLIEMGNRPSRIYSPSALRAVWLALWIAMIFEDLATTDNEHQETADRWRDRYSAAWQALTYISDEDLDGEPDEGRRSLKRTVWLNSRA